MAQCLSKAANDAGGVSTNNEASEAIVCAVATNHECRALVELNQLQSSELKKKMKAVLLLVSRIAQLDPYLQKTWVPCMKDSIRLTTAHAFTSTQPQRTLALLSSEDLQFMSTRALGIYISALCKTKQWEMVGSATKGCVCPIDQTMSTEHCFCEVLGYERM